MKKAVFLFSVFTLVCASPAFAAGAKKPLTAQQKRMKECAAQYHQKNIPKNQYRAFLKVCLKKKTPEVAKPETIDEVLRSVSATKK